MHEKPTNRRVFNVFVRRWKACRQFSPMISLPGCLLKALTTINGGEDMSKFSPY